MIFRFSWSVLSAGTKEPVNAMGSSARVGLPIKNPEGRTYSPPARGWWYCLRQPCALRGGCGVCGRLQPMPSCLRACRSSAARLTHISHADSDQHGKYAAGMKLMPVNRVLQTCHRQLCRGMDACGHPVTSLLKEKQKQALRSRKGERYRWQFTITLSASEAVAADNPPALPLPISAVPSCLMIMTVFSMIIPGKVAWSGNRSFCRPWPLLNGRTGKPFGTLSSQRRNPKTTG